PGSPARVSSQKMTMRRMHGILHEKPTFTEHPGLVVDLADFEGYEGLAAFRKDVKMDTAHRNDFARIAIVADRKWDGMENEPRG
uniref:STAS/SEC14 domain-containing protein n=1 Tax=Tateyamaria sp. syn59 TaxID=2576942 RepID=UPI001CB89A79